ncbi:MAG: hypothetical protein J6Y36_02535 [Treponema sp.]|nr:hypothetical protein [Treponema sp.]
MKKVLSRAVLCALLTLAVFFTACKNPSSGGGGGNSGGGSAYNPPEKNIPLTLEAIADGQITFSNLDRITNLKYRINDGDVTAATNTGISLPAGDKISLFAEGTSNGFRVDQYFTIKCSSDCYVYGNVMSLLTEDYQTSTEITQDIAGLFFNNSHIKNHPSKNIVLPATTLAQSCYVQMFSFCTSLTQAPVLPATTLAEGCYFQMFYGCTSLNKVTCLATDLSAAGCTFEWLYGVASSGTFTKASGADWSSGESGIPSGWTIKNK